MQLRCALGCILTWEKYQGRRSQIGDKSVIARFTMLTTADSGSAVGHGARIPIGCWHPVDGSVVRLWGWAGIEDVGWPGR